MSGGELIKCLAYVVNALSRLEQKFTYITLNAHSGKVVARVKNPFPVNDFL